MFYIGSDIFKAGIRADQNISFPFKQFVTALIGAVTDIYVNSMVCLAELFRQLIEQWKIKKTVISDCKILDNPVLHRICL